MKLLRRRWPVIAVSVLVAASLAWVYSEATSEEAPLPAGASTTFGATILLWDPGAEATGAAGPAMSPAALAQVVEGPNVAPIAAEIMYFSGDPAQLLPRVRAGVDPSTGYLRITGIGKDAASAETIANAFSQGLIVHLTRLQATKIDQERHALQDRIAALTESGAGPVAIEALRDRLRHLSVQEAVPVSLAVLQQVPPTPTPLAAGDADVATEAGLWVPDTVGSRVLLASLLGLLVGILLALVLERFDTRIRSSGRAEEAFGMPVLAEVPAIPAGRRDGVVMASHPYSRAGNAFRLIQTGTARWHAARRGAMTILVTSPEARDGKTTVAANLAAAYAQAGNRVLVVSCDLRRPAIHEMFGLADEPGLTDALRAIDDDGGSLDLSGYLKPCSVLRVAVLPSGRATDRPSEILGSAAMQHLGERLKKITDVVILDGAPLVVAGDVVPLLALADGVVVVARAGKTRRLVATGTATLLERHGRAEGGVVLNDAREFSIPLAKRGMYRPSRSVRKAAEKSAQQRADEDWIPKPLVEPQVVEPEVVEPEVVEEPAHQDEIVMVPDVAEPVARPVEEASRSRGSASEGLKALREELTALRAELGEVPVETPEAPDPSFPIGFRPGSGDER